MGNGIARVAATAGFEVTLGDDADDVNRACMLAFNHPMGPLATVDTGGLGHYGRQTGRGFSEYGSAQ